MKSDHMKELEASMNHTLELICESSNDRDKDYFKSEYFRLKSIYDEEVTNWIAIL